MQKSTSHFYTLFYIEKSESPKEQFLNMSEIRIAWRRIYSGNIMTERKNGIFACWDTKEEKHDR